MHITLQSGRKEIDPETKAGTVCHHKNPVIEDSHDSILALSGPSQQFWRDSHINTRPGSVACYSTPSSKERKNHHANTMELRDVPPAATIPRQPGTRLDCLYSSVDSNHNHADPANHTSPRQPCLHHDEVVHLEGKQNKYHRHPAQRAKEVQDDNLPSAGQPTMNIPERHLSILRPNYRHGSIPKEDTKKLRRQSTSFSIDAPTAQPTRKSSYIH